MVVTETCSKPAPLAIPVGSRTADITVFGVREGEFEFSDAERQVEKARRNLEVLYTVRAGQIVKKPNAEG